MDCETNKRLGEIHTRFRSYITHEDDLIYQRTTLLVTVQSFLIATFGFSYQKKYEIAFQIISHQDTAKKMVQHEYVYNIFLLLLCVGGFSIALMTIFAVMAASKAIVNLHTAWREASSSYVLDTKSNSEYKIPKEFPDVIGGGLRSSAQWGVILSFVLPILFSLFWFSVALFMLVTIKLV